MRAQGNFLQEAIGNQVRHMIEPDLEGDVAGGGVQGKPSLGWVQCTHSQSSHVSTRHWKVCMFSSRHHLRSYLFCHAYCHHAGSASSCQVSEPLILAFLSTLLPVLTSFLRLLIGLFSLNFHYITFLSQTSNSISNQI